MKISKKEKIIGVFVILVIVLNFIPTSYYVRSPGIARELSTMISVENGYVEGIEGQFLLTAVSSHQASIYDIVYISLFNPEGKELDAVYEELPPGVDMNQYIQIMEQLMEESKLHAQAAAFEEAGHEVEVIGDGAKVVQVMEEGTAKEKLEPEDIIIEVEGQPVEFATDAVNFIRAYEVGEIVEISVLRDNEEKTFNIQTVELDSEPGKASIGVLITTHNLEFNFPRNVTFETDRIVGPSAGGMFALEIFNQLVAEDITKGRKIAGTGTISSEGDIGKIDGVKQKVMAAEDVDADIFISPEENFEIAEETAREIEVFSAANFKDILQYLENLEELRRS